MNGKLEIKTLAEKKYRHQELKTLRIFNNYKKAVANSAPETGRGDQPTSGSEFHQTNSIITGESPRSEEITPPGVRSAQHSGPLQLRGDPQRQKRGGNAWWAPTRRLEKWISNLDMRHGTCPDFQPSLLVDDDHWWPSFKRSKMANVPQRFIKFFNLTLVKTIPTPSLGSLSRRGCADDGPSSQVSWPRAP